MEKVRKGETLHNLIIQIFIGFLVLTRCGTAGYGFGGPIVSCINGYPKHHVDVQTSPSPYVIRVNASVYKPNDVIEVTLTSPVNWKFRGFQLRAHRSAGDVEEILGDFISAPATVQKQFWYPENDEQYNCVTHASKDDKDSVVLHWRAPNDTQGDILFSSTFVKSFDMIWIQVQSMVIKAFTPKVTPVDYLGKVEQSMQPLRYSEECGVTRGCLLYPRFCSGDDCDHVVSYALDESRRYVDFEMMSTTSGYVSVGISHDIKMSQDQTISCISQGSRVTVQNGFNPSLYNGHHRIIGITNAFANKTKDKIYCRFRRPISMTISNIMRSNDGTRPKVRPVEFDLSKPWYFFIAWGAVYPGTFILGHHEVLPVVSAEKIDVSSSRVHYGDSLHRDLKIHGTLMLIAWIFFAGMTTILARYFRQAMDRLCCHLAVWFQLHRACAMLAAACTIAGTVIIFVYLEEWTEYATVHAVLGLVVVGLVLMQIIAGMCRPDKDSKRRKFFNLIHRFSGKSTQILAAICLFFAFQVPLIPARLRLVESVILAVWVGVQLMWELLLEFCLCRYAGSGNKEKTLDDGMAKRKSKKSAFVIAYFMYTLTMGILLFASIYFILIS